MTSKAVGKEADECFYIKNEAAVRGKLKIDLTVDPPPDLAIEIDVSNSSLDKMAPRTQSAGSLVLAGWQTYSQHSDRCRLWVVRN